MAGIILLRAKLGLRPKRLGNPFGRALIIGRKGGAHMAVNGGAKSGHWAV